MSFQEHGRVLFSATLVQGHIAKFHIPYLRWFKEQGWETWVAAKNDYPGSLCKIPYCDHFVNIDFARSPFTKQTIVAYRQLRELFSKTKFDIVHTHTPVGGVLTRLAARDERRNGTKVIYTAHGFHFYKGAPFLNWALWFPVECVMTSFTDILICINQEDYKRAKCFSRCRVEYVPGVGINTSRFSTGIDRKAKRQELHIKDEEFVLLSVGDLIPRKNQGVIIQALSQLPHQCRLIVCGEGPERNELLALANDLDVSDRVSLLGFRNDISEIMAASDCLVFPSIHEGLPVSVMEAMASGLPVIASRIRGIDPDLLCDSVNGLLLNKVDARDIRNAVLRIIDDEMFREQLIQNAMECSKKFDISSILRIVTPLYQ